jgi:hypothetical protein
MLAAKPMGMVDLVLPGWLGYPAAAAWWALEALSGGYLRVQVNKLTLLDNAVQGFGGIATRGRVGDASRRQRLVTGCGLDGERRRLFGVGGDAVEAVTGAKQGRTWAQPRLQVGTRCGGRAVLTRTYGGRRVGQKWVSRHLVATCQ